MTDDQERIRDALEFWRAEREQLFLQIGAYRDGLIRVQRHSADGWVDITEFQQDGEFTRLKRISEIVEFFEGLIKH